MSQGWTDERRKAQSLRMQGNTLRRGKRVAPEVRRRISQTMKGRPSNFKGKRLTPEQRRHLSEAHKAHWANPENRKARIRAHWNRIKQKREAAE